MSDQTLRSFMFKHSGSFVGFLESVSSVLASLGDEWWGAGEKAYAEAFYAGAKSILAVSSSLANISVDYEKRQEVPEKIDIATEYKKKVLALIK